MSEDPQAFGRRLGAVFERHRLAAGVSRTRLSEISGVGRTGVILFERGERMPSVHIAKALADGLGVPLSRLVEEAENAK